MRNLKRVLSLALALVMILGMMVMGAGAASTDFADGSEITYAEAADVMNALGVIEGSDDGNFYPDLLLSRAEAAAIICRMLMGPENAKTLAGSIVATEFEDVPANAWYAPYVSFCASLGIISGDGEGHFFPTAKLTGLAFGKMLLVALGYDAKAEGYSYNEGYVGHITNDMMAAGINISGVVLTDEVTRDQACQMALNTLQATLVDYETKGSSITVNGAELVFGASAAKPVTTTIAKEQTISDTQLTNTGYYTIEFAEKYFPHLTCVTTLDGMGHYAHEWLLKNDSIGRYAEEPDYSAHISYNRRGNQQTLAEVVSDINKKFQISTADLYINGLLEEDFVARNPVHNGVSTGKYVGAPGDLVEIYMDEDSVNVIDRIVVTHSTVATVNAITLTEANGATYIEISGVTTAGLAEYVHGYEDLSRGDVVLYYNDNENHTWIQKADSFNGIMTATTADDDGESTDTPDTYTINGALYRESRQTNWIGVAGLTAREGDTNATFWLDNAGHIIWAEGEDAPTELMLILKNYDYNVSANVFDASKEKSQVLFLNEDAVTSVIKIAEIDNDKNIGDNQAEYNAYSLDDDTYPTYTVNSSYDANSIWGDGQHVKLFTYTEGVKGYDLDSVIETTTSRVITDIVTGLPTYHTGGSQIGYQDSDWTTNSQTIYLVRDVDKLTGDYDGLDNDTGAAIVDGNGNAIGGNTWKDTFTAYVGYENVPTLLNAMTITYEERGAAKYVVVVGYDDISNNADELFYAISNDITAVYTTASAREIAYYTVKGVLDGAIVDLKLNKDGAADMNTGFGNTLWNVTKYDADGYVDEIVQLTSLTKYYVGMTGTEAARNGVLKLDTQRTDVVNPNVKAFSYSDSTIVYTINNGVLTVGGVDTISTDTNDLVAAVTKGGQYGQATNREATIIFVQKIAPTASRNALRLYNSAATGFEYIVNTNNAVYDVDGDATVLVAASDTVTIKSAERAGLIFTVTNVEVNSGACNLINNGNGTWTVKNVSAATQLNITVNVSPVPAVSVNSDSYTVDLTGNSASAAATINEIIDQLMDLGYARSEITVTYNNGSYIVTTTQNNVSITWGVS